MTLLVARKHRNVAARIGVDFLAEESCDLVWVNEQHVWDAWKVFISFDDKTWSFTDCVSYAVMAGLEIKEALALDEHFKQFGIANVLP